MTETEGELRVYGPAPPGGRRVSRKWCRFTRIHPRTVVEAIKKRRLQPQGQSCQKDSRRENALAGSGLPWPGCWRSVLCV